jgi:hypothetical protein
MRVQQYEYQTTCRPTRGWNVVSVVATDTITDIGTNTIVFSM